MPRSPQLPAKWRQSRRPASSSTSPISRARTKAKPLRATASAMAAARLLIPIGLHQVRGGLFVDAAQQPPIAEQVARPDFADGQLAVVEKGVEREVGVKPDMAGEMRQPPLHKTQ